jgi:molecular chaperone DnaK
MFENGDKVEIDTKIGELSTAAQKLGEKVYADMQAQEQAGAAGGSRCRCKSKDDDVVDADFKEVKDNK